ncbi:MICAL-like protein 1 isoform X2 [Anopheles cruzii]|nr:MICAL-like protein 1 isoform X2 [Anopheles cruzii]
MVKYEVPDRFSILTYLSQYYRVFSNQEPATSKKASDKDTKPDDLSSKMANNIPAFVGVPKRATCARCSNPIFLAERISFGAKSYHRSCLKCARCGTQLTVGSFYETETDGEYCCETCPDEEIQLEIKRRKSSASSSSDGSHHSSGSGAAPVVPLVGLPRTIRSSKLLDRISFFESAPLSDEEKTSNLERKAKMSSFLKGTLDESDRKLPDSPVVLQEPNGKPDTEEDRRQDDVPPDLPTTAPPAAGDEANAESKASSTEPPVPAEDSESIEDQFEKIVQDLGNDELSGDTTNRLPQTEIAQRQLDSASVEQEESPRNHNSELRNVSELTDAQKEVDESEIMIVVEDADDKTPEVVLDEAAPDKQATVVESHEPSNLKTEEPTVVGEVSKTAIVALRTTASEETEPSAPAVPVSEVPSEVLVESETKCNVPDEKESTEPEPEEAANSSRTEQEPEVPEEEDVCEGHEEVVGRKLSTSDAAETPTESKSVAEHDKAEPTEESTTSQQPEESALKNEELYPSDLNPFGDEDENGAKIVALPGTPTMKPAPSVRRVSTNPFGSEDEDDDAQQPQSSPSSKPPRPPPPKVKSTAAVNSTPVPVNPFDEDDDDAGTTEQEAEIVPVVSKPSPRRTPVPTPRKPGHAYNDSISSQDNSLMSSSRLSSSNVSLASSMDSGPSSMTVPRRRKSKAPNVPVPKPSGEGALTAVGGAIITSSIANKGTLTTPRKKRNAPAPPPAFTSTPKPEQASQQTPASQRLLTLDASLIGNDRPEASESMSRATSNESVVYRRLIVPLALDDDGSEAPLDDSTTTASVTSERQWEKMKDNKEAQNRNRQSQSSPIGEGNGFGNGLSVLANKSSQGKWKRRKGPAPALPMALPLPERKPIKMLPLKEIHQELQIIETQQQGLEKQGIVLEKMIRERCEGVEADIDLDIRLQVNSKEVEDLIMQLFELVNEKNELFRRQAELMYLRRMHRLEQEQADLEYEIRLLMAQPERNKTDSDKEKEEALIARLVEIVQMRNEVVECLEMDRIREAEEDLSIKQSIEERAASQQSKHGKKDSTACTATTLPLTDSEKQDSTVKLSKKEKKKLKEAKKLVKSKKIDSEKDADETESGSTKEKKKKRKFLF